jgi:tRNA(Ile)-lysidine synthase
MLLELEKKIAVFLQAIEFPNSKVNILLAVSGGADSIALLHVLHALISYKHINADLYCAHFNHKLRSDSDSDEEFVISQAQKFNIPITTKRFDVEKYARNNKLSIETAARQLRIENLTKIAKTNKCKWIATGHQKDDNAETIIHRILRGTGYRGLAGIWPLRKFNEDVFFVRPLLCVSREEIVQYLQQRNLNWHEDYTNAEFKYTRNHILQKQCENSLVEQLSKLSVKADSLYKQICNKVNTLWPEVSICNDNKISLKRNILQSQLPSVQIELIRRALSAISCGERDLTSEHYERILELIKHGYTGKTIQLPNGFDVYMQYEYVIFKKCRVGHVPPDSSFLNGGVEPHPTILKLPGQTVFNEFTIDAAILEEDKVDFKKFLKSKTSSIEWFDLDKIKEPLIVRFRKDGDRFVPFSQKKQKKIGKFLTAQHVTEEVRSKIIVFEDSEKIIWLYPIRTSEQTRIISETKTILQLHISKK